MDEVADKELIRLLRSGHTLTECSEAFNVHRTTLWRWLQKKNGWKGKYPECSVDDVCALICHHISFHGYARDWGIRMIQTKLRRLGWRVTRARVRDALDRMYPGLMLNRAHHTRARRIYDIVNPMHIWHMDSYDKLARWGIRVHGAIDGATHYVVYMHVALNKKAETIFAGYKEAILKFGHPLLIRSDFATEHGLVEEDLQKARPNGYCFRTGASVHNQRIEAHWRQVRDHAMDYFIETLYNLTVEEAILRVEDPLHRYSLVTVFLPLVKAAMEDFVSTWNGHRVRKVGPRPSHIPENVFQAAAREAKLVLPPPYDSNAYVNIPGPTEIEEVLQMERDDDEFPVDDELVRPDDDTAPEMSRTDYWNHNNDNGEFEKGIRDLSDEGLREIRNIAYEQNKHLFVEDADKFKFHLFLSLECDRCIEEGIPLSTYVQNKIAVANLQGDQEKILSILERTLRYMRFAH